MFERKTQERYFLMISTVFPLISALGAYWILKLLGAALIEGGANQREALISKLKEMNNIKCQNLIICSFKIRMKYKSSISIHQI